jgi:serine/threonine-protein kinase
MASLSDAVISHLCEAVTVPDFSGTRYSVIGEIGRGGMGTVYLGLDSQLGRRVAFKVLDLVDSDGRAAERMAEEARILARLEHPGIVAVHDMGKLPDGRVFYVMKFVEGARLDRWARSELPAGERLRVFLRICETVAFAHSQGIIHRDLKPQNIMVGRFGEVLVLDWGVAKITDTGREFASASGAKAGGTEAGTVIGTEGYMPPEQASASMEKVDARSDVYALGKTLKTLMEAGGGRIPKRLRAIWRKASRPEPELRYATALEMAADIERFQNGDRILAYHETAGERAGRWLARNQTVALLAATYLVMRILLFFFNRR